MLRRILKPSFSPLSKSINCQLKYKYFNQQPNNFDASKDYYRILQLDKNATENDIKKSYYRMAKQYHPDVNKGYQTRFKEISQAYQVLSNQQIKKQYDSARVFREGWSKMGSKAQQGSYSYEEYQNVFYNMSPQQRQQFQRQAQARLRRFGMIFGGFILFWLFFSRTPHKAYTEFNGTLIPIDPRGAFQYPDPYLQQAQVYNPHQQAGNYGQPNNPYANQPYQPHPQQYPAQSYGTSSQYGSQYPQAQYLNTYNQYQQQPVQSQQQPYYPQQSYSPQPQQKSQYTIDRPQPHQPYPNSGYAEKPLQSNYRPGHKPEAPAGLED